MKLGKCKQALADLINANGGWADGSGFASQDKVGSDHDGSDVCFYKYKPIFTAGKSMWNSNKPRGCVVSSFKTCVIIENWNQTILSREEYYQAYPKSDADGWIEWNGGDCPVGEGDRIDVKFSDGDEFFDVSSYWGWGADAGCCNIIAYRLHKPEVKPEFCESVMRSIPGSESIDELCAKVTEENKHQHVDANPTIEQLAQDYRSKLDYANRKQDEADKANMDSDAALSQLEDAISAIGFAITPLAATDKEPELVITDWRDLRVGDEVELVIKQGGLAMVGEVGVISHAFGNGDFNVDFPSHRGYSVDHCDIKFIRRP